MSLEANLSGQWTATGLKSFYSYICFSMFPARSLRLNQKI